MRCENLLKYIYLNRYIPLRLKKIDIVLLCIFVLNSSNRVRKNHNGKVRIAILNTGDTF